MFFAQISVFHGNGIWKQPGPVEAVKQMLFRLQAVEAELERQQKELATPPLFTCGPKIPENLVESPTQRAEFAPMMLLQ